MSVGGAGGSEASWGVRARSRSRSTRAACPLTCPVAHSPCSRACVRTHSYSCTRFRLRSRSRSRPCFRPCRRMWRRAKGCSWSRRWANLRLRWAFRPRSYACSSSISRALSRSCLNPSCSADLSSLRRCLSSRSARFRACAVCLFCCLLLGPGAAGAGVGEGDVGVAAVPREVGSFVQWPLNSPCLVWMRARISSTPRGEVICT